ncbi:MAG TPA: hypothetical protein DDZ89_16750, partial [Clostridiales bacterium]|nr:hypothetical protein [Clostridiales bacterium]
MKICVHNIKCDIDNTGDRVIDLAAKKAGISKDSVLTWRLLKKSIDARDKTDIKFVYSALLEIPRGIRFKNHKDVKVYLEPTVSELQIGNVKLQDRPVIIGSGPCGLFASLLLARYGFCPILIEKGGSIEERTAKVKHYWDTDELDENCNVQFGEGGAGTFSDGKLTTGITDPWCDFVLKQFVQYGAPEEIMIDAKPHIGTDRLRETVVNIRNDIIRMGGTVLFNTQMQDVSFHNGSVQKITTNDAVIPCEVLVLALGHSARETFQMLLSKGVPMIQKPMSVGVRVEHHQSMINEARYGSFASKLPPADYKLSSKVNGRGVYSFCMCPGGVVVGAASEKNTIVTNGMSYYARDLKNANAALVVSVGPADYPSEHPLAGVEYQRMLEQAAFIAGSGKAPAQRIKDFFEGKPTCRFGSVIPSYTQGVTPGSMEDCLPEYI